MNRRINTLMKEIKKLALEWKPALFIITGGEGDYTLIAEEWDGVVGSTRESGHRAEYKATTKTEAKQIAELLLTDYICRSGDQSARPNLIDCSEPTYEECKEAWRRQGGTLMERMAEEDGLPLLDEIKKVYGQDVRPEEMSVWRDIIRWRQEDGLDV